MTKIRIGIQGTQGSTNDRACTFFAKKHQWKNYNVQYLISTKKVLDSLNNGLIDFGTFAWESSRKGLVEETQKAIKKYKYQKIDEVKLQSDHALLSNNPIDSSKTVNIFSHPQAFKEHGLFLKEKFPKLKLFDEVDTAVAAFKLKSGDYPENSLVIASITCAKIYNLDVYIKNLPSNKGYFTTIYLVRLKADAVVDKLSL